MACLHKTGSASQNQTWSRTREIESRYSTFTREEEKNRPNQATTPAVSSSPQITIGVTSYTSVLAVCCG
ncbi:hypothetical protein Pmani_000548 [Petrolisthes manimaculis]|uniref:Uncharacterized protein n=1 Tax=Petrolisthes manimaculis TaxID=1843537 RepID=A0AAE1Q8P9_9EUCA|nr:hypothetical protein Pmani_007551 [Petrolisthes manimaculis]KAK4329068.1 hypothetical protein Pmani_000548 [Petrolisthes manimaculis]